MSAFASIVPHNQAVRRPRPRTRRRGLGLIEMVISFAIAAMLLTAVAAAFSATTSAIEANDQFFRASQAARVSINQIMAEVRRCQSGVVDLNELELITAVGQTRVYAYDAVNRRLTMTFTDEAVPPTYTLARNVDSAQFFTDGDTIAMAVTIAIGNNRVTLNGSAMPRRTVEFN